MKQIVKKNQIIIAALAVMIAAAGYLNYSGKIFGGDKETETASADLANQELLDISEEDLASASEDIESQDGGEGSDGSVDGTPGEAVLTLSLIHISERSSGRRTSDLCLRALTMRA